MRSQDEIVERIDSIWDPIQWQRATLIGCLDFDHARPFLLEEATADAWRPTLVDADVRAEIREYMATIAWPAVVDHHGVSASRSIEKLIGWLWALDHDDLLVRMETTAFPQYGAPRLRVVCDAYGYPVPDDEGVARMINGLPCRVDCDHGCVRV